MPSALIGAVISILGGYPTALLHSWLTSEPFTLNAITLPKIHGEKQNLLLCFRYAFYEQ